jgi:predicted NUDIX family NTP pyrophosphohydrolase
MAKTSAGLLMYRIMQGEMEVLLVHPGGPFWRHKDEGAWSIPKGEIEPDEAPLPAAQREFEEETGIKPSGKFISLDSAKLKSGKIIQAWAFEGNCDPAQIKSNTFPLEWPPKSGKMQEFAEIDRAAFWRVPQAKTKINPAQVVFLERLENWRRGNTND